MSRPENYEAVKKAFEAMSNADYGLTADTLKITGELGNDIESELVRVIQNHIKRCAGVGFNKSQALGVLASISTFIPMCVYVATIEALDEYSKGRRIYDGAGITPDMPLEEKVRRARAYRDSVGN
jgi:hypothetical protein